MTPRYTANTNFRSHRPKKGFTRFLAEPKFSERWLNGYVCGRIKGHSDRWVGYSGDLIRLHVKFNRNEQIKFFGIIINAEDPETGLYWCRFYNTKEEAINQRTLRDLQSPEDWFTYVFKLNMADYRDKPHPDILPQSLLRS